MSLSRLRAWVRRLLSEPEPAPASPSTRWGAKGMKRATQALGKPLLYDLKAPDILPGVVPSGVRSGITMDSVFEGLCAQGFPGFIGGSMGDFAGFPGFQYLATLQTRAEYRQMATVLASELTREWIRIDSTETAGMETRVKITEITEYFKKIGVRQIVQRLAEDDAYFGRAQVFLDIQGQNGSKHLPLVIKPGSIKKGTEFKLTRVEAIWTTPVVYDALNPLDQWFYKPSKWWMLGQEVHSDRLLTITTRPVSDLLKPAFNFAGMSLSQLAEPYVNNWLRTRQSVADLINNFSIIALSTDMGTSLQDPDCDGQDLINRVELFTATRSNRGLFMLNKETEEIELHNVSLAGLHELQGQAHEQLCTVSHIPAVILTGLSPTGLNASSDGEIRAHYDWIASQQEAHWSWLVQLTFVLTQLCLYGEVDPDLSWTWQPLYQQTPKELAELQKTEADAANIYMTAGVVYNDEVREKLARDPRSGYQGLDLNRELPQPDEFDEEKGNNDKED